ncbi:phosphoribosylanthranilate isomerase [Natrarchaeobaculum aegyptiacum]|uniref:N-(5'-phosphoribosyl)anthranilate isomerase n=1 Tax=Natrarchaeobaculum aegyptiacum TaxID=745377 RepID=A0A2Z2HTL8_9EURY|nr:phosphoribosylanthranilate isomerase [Natrarchaeobaculum aegyptiacum]ARS88414.1 N-(5'-phosphoribosyl)anthranilate isomerase [Natrarchaeobaculum aegyptiacum]
MNRSRGRTRVKVCGLTNEDDLGAAVDAGADAVGTICDVPVETPREVDRDRAKELVAGTPPFVTSVLVTMPTDVHETIDLVEAVGPDALQLHGSVDLDALETIRASVDVSLLLAVDADDLAAADRYDEVVDGFVVDTTDEEGAGGTGETHDWENTREAGQGLESPVVLAGGLTPENVADAIETVDPFAVDVASGVERSGGVKDPDAVTAFVERATAAGDAANRDDEQRRAAPDLEPQP